MTGNKRAILILVAVLLGAVAWLYLANTIFLAGSKIGKQYAMPFELPMYLYHYSANKKVAMWANMGMLIALVPFLVIGALIVKGNQRSLHGDAKLAKAADIKKAGLFSNAGIIVGKFAGKFLVLGGPRHVAVSAPTRSGKGVSIVIPNCLSWGGSMVNLDVKLENFNITSAYRQKHGQAVYLFAPGAEDGRTHRYNPLSYVSKHPAMRVDDVQKIANLLFPDQQGVDPIWTATPRQLFSGIVLYLIETPGSLVTIGQVLRETYVGGDAVEHFKNLVEDRHSSGNPLSNACEQGLKSYYGISAPNTRTGIITSFRSRLELWSNPLIDAATSHSDFDLERVRKDKISIYLGITPGNLARFSPLVNLFFSQLIELNIRTLPEDDPSIKHTCLLLLDEATAPGKIQILMKAISYIAGYWLRVLTIVQSPEQIRATYTKEEGDNYLTNHGCLVVFAPKASESRLAKEYSEWLGYDTVKSKSTSKGAEIFKKKNRTESESDQRRAVLLPQEVIAIGEKKAIIIAENVPPIIADKAKYFIEDEFMDRLKDVSPTLRASTKGLKGLFKRHPSHNDLAEAIQNGELRIDVPTINIDEHLKTVKAYSGIRVYNKAANSGETRPFEAKDVDNLRKIQFSFNSNSLDSVDIAKMSNEQIAQLADKFCADNGIPVSS